jgi:Rieske Fe-S protein
VSDPGHDTPHQPGPSLWPIGFAVGVACLLLGLVLSWIIAAVGLALAVIFGILWARAVTREVRGEVPEVEPEMRTVADASAPAEAPAEVPTAVYTRSKFLEASTIGVGAAIGALVSLPVLGFMVLPSFTHQSEPDVDLGPIDNFREGEYVIATYSLIPKEGEVTRRTAFVRSNGLVRNPAHNNAEEPSFTILYSRCVHLGCPVQPNGPINTAREKKIGDVELRPVLAQSFGCPCHGGLYDAEGNRKAGPGRKRRSPSTRGRHPVSTSRVPRHGCTRSCRVR